MEDFMRVAALEEAEVAVVEGTDNDGSLGGYADTSTPHQPESGALAPKLIAMGRREDVVSGTGKVITGGTGHPLNLPGGREL